MFYQIKREKLTSKSKGMKTPTQYKFFGHVQFEQILKKSYGRKSMNRDNKILRAAMKIKN